MKKLAWIQQRGRKRTLKSIKAPVYKVRFRLDKFKSKKVGFLGLSKRIALNQCKRS